MDWRWIVYLTEAFATGTLRQTSHPLSPVPHSPTVARDWQGRTAEYRTEGYSITNTELINTLRYSVFPCSIFCSLPLRWRPDHRGGEINSKSCSFLNFVGCGCQRLLSLQMLCKSFRPSLVCIRAIYSQVGLLQIGPSHTVPRISLTPQRLSAQSVSSVFHSIVL
jgi:hypothetical protein